MLILLTVALGFLVAVYAWVRLGAWLDVWLDGEEGEDSE